MRLNVNLATRPYEDVRQFLLRWGSLTLALALITGGLVYYSIHNWQASSDVNRQIASMQEQMRKLDQERATAIATLNEPNNKVIADQTKFLNNTIQRKAVSWTRIFMDLERIMPNQLHVVSITPELNPQNQLLIHLQVAGESTEHAIDLVRRMEESSTFKDAQLHTQTMTKGTGRNDTVQFEITSIYVPGPDQPAKAERASTLAKSGGGQ